MKEKAKVSVIVPIFNVERYIEKCLISLFEQTLTEIEYIFINDASPDQSMVILNRISENYPERKEWIKIINHKGNKGVALSRQEGVDNASGEYIIHCDPDDWVETTMYEEMYNAGVSHNADMIGCDFIDEYENHTVYRKQNFQLRGEEACKEILEGKLHSGLWCRMIKKSLLDRNKNRFDENISYMEDLLYVFPIHLKNINIYYLPKGFYHYRQTENSLTHNLTKKQLDSIVVVLEKIYTMIHDKTTMYNSYQKAVANHSRGLITMVDNYNPDLWRKLTQGIPLSYFGNLRQKLSPLLVRYHLSFVNKLLLKGLGRK